MKLNSWIAAHTFHHTQFADLPALVEAKRKQRLRISVCIPTLNEEQTIGKVIVILRAELMKRYPLIDELVVIDSGSQDKTLEIARAFGANTYLADDILPTLEPRRGKGENLWKAIYQLTGDIIVYIDADIKNIHPRFVYGLVGPLISDSNIKYVKAFYDRPLAVSQGVTRPTGGGRVTEILIRPLFSLFYPELTAIIQPLSGEYAARREVLEALPFPIGYGVETSHLIDIYTRWSMSSFAQTDLDQRVHRNQSTLSLGRMSFGILRTFLRRAKNLGLCTFHKELEHVLRQFQSINDTYQLQEHTIIEEERPAMNELTEYQQRARQEDQEGQEG